MESNGITGEITVNLCQIVMNEMISMIRLVRMNAVPMNLH